MTIKLTWELVLAGVLFFAAVVVQIWTATKSVLEVKAIIGEPKRKMKERLDKVEETQEDHSEELAKHTEEIKSVKADTCAIMEAQLAMLRHFERTANGDKKELEKAHEDLSKHITDSKK